MTDVCSNCVLAYRDGGCAAKSAIEHAMTTAKRKPDFDRVRRLYANICPLLETLFIEVQGEKK